MNRALGMLGLCARARKLVSGEKACLQAIRSETARVALIDAGASENARNALKSACASHGVPLLTVPEGALGEAIGQPARLAAAIIDAGMAKRVMELAGEESGMGFAATENDTGVH